MNRFADAHISRPQHGQRRNGVERGKDEEEEEEEDDDDDDDDDEVV